METHPGIIADMIAAAADAKGAVVVVKDADDRSAFGRVVITMPDGMSYEIKIEEL